MCARIETLRDSYLVELAHGTSGWNTLYRDPEDGRLWELSYPQGELHGGGPPQLALLAVRQAVHRYGSEAVDAGMGYDNWATQL